MSVETFGVDEASTDPAEMVRVLLANAALDAEQRMLTIQIARDTASLLRTLVAAARRRHGLITPREMKDAEAAIARLPDYDLLHAAAADDHAKAVDVERRARGPEAAVNA